jgi:uncharacterized protein YdhG (YjbR/CyaY superfamily)
MAAEFNDVASYMATVPEAHRPALEALYKQIKKLYPDFTEHIRWSQPLFKLNSQTVCAFKAYKNHCSLGVWSDTAMNRVGDLLTEYDRTDSTLRFPPHNPPPEHVIKAILDERVKEIEGE